MLYDNKKGVGVVVGNVLLILLVVVLSVIVFTLSRNFMRETQRQAEIERACDSIEFISGQYCYRSYMIENLATGQLEESYNIEFDVRNSASESVIYGFTLIISTNGSSESIPSLYGSEIGGGVSKKIQSSFIDDYLGSDEIGIVPVYNYENELISCGDKSISIKTSEVNEC